MVAQHGVPVRRGPPIPGFGGRLQPPPLSITHRGSFTLNLQPVLHCLLGLYDLKFISVLKLLLFSRGLRASIYGKFSLNVHFLLLCVP